MATCNASHEARFARAMGKAFVMLSASEVSINAKLKMTNLVVLLNSLAKAKQHTKRYGTKDSPSIASH